MKKTLFSLLLTISFTSIQATTLIIDNSSSGNVQIPFIQTVNLDSNNNVISSISFYGTVSNNWISISSGSVYSITDNLSNNYQFPFLNQYPFIGQVSTTLPLPVTNDNLNPSSERYILSLFRFAMNDYLAYSFSTHNVNTYNYDENVVRTFPYQGGGSTFDVNYARFFSYYTIIFI
jgi:hypothetical protein